ncbi:MAG: hypothetical protein HQM09_16610 [Candidatus Riflebacteria bacterium]|nr:hypothetical protein [Candidatus Riflebacteria bacterium]
MTASIFRQFRLLLLVSVFHGITFFPFTTPATHGILLACDDSLLALLTADDPESAFSQGIKEFHSRLSALGAALKDKRSAIEIEPLLTNLMEAWLAFSGKYMVNPPEKARNDPDWQKKMEEAADRIGAIRKSIMDKRLTDAHDAVLDLSTRVSGFFDGFGLSPLKRAFIEVSRSFEEFDRSHLSHDIVGMRAAQASLTALVATFTPLVNAASRQVFERLNMSVDSLSVAWIPVQTQTRETPSPSTESLVTTSLDNARRDFQDLRSRLLMADWFPKLDLSSKSIASDTTGVVSSGVSVTTDLASGASLHK